MRFEFAAPTLIRFGEGTLAELGSLAAERGSRALVVEGGSGRAEPAVELLGRSGVETTRFRVPGEPTTRLIEEGAAIARRARCELVIAFGGGSVIDAAKAISALLTNPGELKDYLEIVGKGQPITRRAAPVIAVPTTAGTGTEVTRNSVLTAEAERVKVSMRSPLMVPEIALVDPEVTYDLPPRLTATTGLDALTQCIEPLVSRNANPLTDGIAREGIVRIAGALRRAFHDGSDRDARRDMAVGSLFGGLALANSKLGAVHGLAAPLGGMFPVPHGAVCARLLAPVVRVNLEALRTREPGSSALDRYVEIARLLTGEPAARADDAASWLDGLVEELGVPGLERFGVPTTAHPAIADQALKSSSMQGNPLRLTQRELEEVLAAAS